MCPTHIPTVVPRSAQAQRPAGRVSAFRRISEAESRGDIHQVGERLGLHLSHHLASASSGSSAIYAPGRHNLSPLLRELEAILRSTARCFETSDLAIVRGRVADSRFACAGHCCQGRLAARHALAGLHADGRIRSRSRALSSDDQFSGARRLRH
jgi:hypothetical protein